MSTNTNTNTKPKTLSVPTSCVRAPGGLLIEKKLGSQPSGITNPSWEAQDTMILANGESFSTEESCSLEDEGIRSFDSFFSMHISDEDASPGRLKNGSDDLGNQIQTTKMILLKHGITLSLDLSGKCFKDASRILKVISSEVPLFPTGFFQEINLKQLVISQESDSRKISNTFSLQTDVLNTEARIEERLYRIIFDHMITVKPEISSDWRDFSRPVGSWEIREAMEIWSLEEVFIGLMRNRTHPLLKQLMASLRELLIEHFAEELTCEWFESRNLMKKRTRRVSFL